MGLEPRDSFFLDSLYINIKYIDFRKYLELIVDC